MIKPWIWLVAGGVLTVLAQGRWIVSIAMWIAPVLLLRFVRVVSPSWSFPSIWVVLYTAAAIANRGVLPLSGVPYFIVTGLDSQRPDAAHV